VVGIVKDVRHISPEMDSGVEFYFPVAQMSDFHTLDLVVRSQRPVPEVAAAVRSALREVDPSMPTREFWTVQSTVDRAVSVRRFTLSVLGVFGAAALLVAALGIYGVVAHSVAERIPEIGIRRALGAPAADVVWSVMSRTLLLAGVGTVGGVLLSLMSARLLASLVYGVDVRDPGTFLVSALVPPGGGNIGRSGTGDAGGTNDRARHPRQELISGRNRWRLSVLRIHRPSSPPTGCPRSGASAPCLRSGRDPG